MNGMHRLELMENDCSSSLNELLRPTAGDIFRTFERGNLILIILIFYYSYFLFIFG